MSNITRDTLIELCNKNVFCNAVYNQCFVENADAACEQLKNISNSWTRSDPSTSASDKIYYSNSKDGIESIYEEDLETLRGKNGESFNNNLSGAVGIIDGDILINKEKINNTNYEKTFMYKIESNANILFIICCILSFILLITNIALTVSRNSQCTKVKNRDDPYYIAEDKKNSDTENLESFSRLQTQKSKISQAKTDDQTFNTINDKYQNVSSAYDNKLAEKQGAESLIVTDRKIESDKKAILEKLITDASKGKKASDLAIEYKKKYDDLVIQYNNMQVKINQAMLDLATKKKSFYVAYIKMETVLKQKKVAIPLIILVVLDWIWNIYKEL